MNEKEKLPKRPVVLLIIISLFLLMTGVAVGEPSEYWARWYDGSDYVLSPSNETDNLQINSSSLFDDTVFISRNVQLRFGIPLVDTAYIYSPISGNLNITCTSLDITGSVTCHSGLGIANGKSLALNDDTGEKAGIRNDLDVMYFEDADLYHFDDEVKTNVGFTSLGGYDYSSYRDVHYGDTDTYREFLNDAISFYCGGIGFFRMYKGAFFGTGIFFNYYSNDIDFLIKGDNDPNLFFIDASQDRVGISTSSPAHTLDVDGDFYADEIVLPTSAPGTAVAGSIYLNATTNLIGTYDGSSWYWR